MESGRKSDRELFDASLDIEDPAGRAAFLDRECAGVIGQRERVQSLLDALENAGEFLGATRVIRAENRKVTSNPGPVVKSQEHGPGAVIGNYKLLQEIGEGGFGVVYMADQLQPVKRKVALKIIKPGMASREVVARFEAERQALALMVHPNIAQVYEAGTTDTGRPFFVMELVKGIPITEFCDKSKLSTIKRLKLFLDVCGAVQHAHQKGVIHRDIKPSNILVTLHDGTPVPKVIDFGIAKALNQELTEKTLFTAYGQMIGTPLYMSPEQAEMSGLDIDTRSDIYSLGVLLYELLTGNTPIRRKELKDVGYQEMQRLIREKEPTKPSMAISILCLESTTLADFRQEQPAHLINAIKGDLDWIVLKALDKDRNRRYETANAFADDIRRFLRHEPVSASPPSFPYLMGKYWRRNQKVLTALAAILVSLVIGTIGMTVLYLRAVDAREETELKRAEAVTARVAESEQRELAQQSTRRVKDTLARADLISGLEMLDQHNDLRALAHLARSLRTDGGFLPAAQALVAALTDRNFNLGSGIVLQQEAPIDQFEQNKRGDLLLSHATDGSVVLWDARTWSARFKSNPETPVRLAFFAPDGEHFLTLSAQGVVQVWNVRTLVQEGRSMTADGGIVEVKTASHPASGLVLATRSGNGRLRVWDGLAGIAKPAPQRLKTQAKAALFDLNPDGSKLIARFGDRLGIWDARTGTIEGSPKHLAPGDRLTMSTGRRLACEVDSKASEIRFFRLGSNETTSTTRFEGTVIDAPVLSPDEARLVILFRRNNPPGKTKGADPSGDLVTQVYDFESGKLLREFVDQNAPRDPIVHAATGVSLLRISDFEVRIRDLKNGDIIENVKLHERLPDSPDDKNVLLFLPSGTRFLVRLDHGGFEVYMTFNGKKQCSTGPQLMPFEKFAFSPEDQRVATTTMQGELQVWDLVMGQALTAPMHHAEQVGDVQFTRDGMRLISADEFRKGDELRSGVLRIWDVLEGRAISEPLALPLITPTPLAVSSGNLLPVVSKDGQAMVVDVTSRSLRTSEAVAGSIFTGAILSPGNDRLIGFGGDGFSIWKLDSPLPVVHQHTVSPVRDVAFSGDGKRLVTIHDNHGIQLWDGLSGAPVESMPPLDRAVISAGFDLNHKRLLVATPNSIWSWSLEDRPPASRLQRALAVPQGLEHAVFSPDGTLCLAASFDDAILWELDSGRKLHSFSHGFSIADLKFSPDGRRVLVTGPDVESSSPLPGHSVLWAADTGNQLADFVHEDQVSMAQFSPDGSFVVTQSRDRALRVWHVETRQRLVDPIWHMADIDSFAISPDGHHLISLSNRQLRMWPMPIGETNIPAWLPELAEAVAGQRLDEQGNVEVLPPSALDSVRSKLAAYKGSDDYARFAHWFLADRSRRALAPGSPEVRLEVVRRLTEQQLPNRVRRALQLDPSSSSAFCKMARKLANVDIKRLGKGLAEGNHWYSYSECYTRMAIEIAPDSLEAWTAHADILHRRYKDAECLVALDQMNAWFPENAEMSLLRALALGRTSGLDVGYHAFGKTFKELLKASDFVPTTIDEFQKLQEGISAFHGATPEDWMTLAFQIATRSDDGSDELQIADWLSRLALESDPQNVSLQVRRAELVRWKSDRTLRRPK